MQSQPLQEEEMDHLSGQFASSVSMGGNAQVKPHREAGWTRWQAPRAAWTGPRNDVGLNALLERVTRGMRTSAHEVGSVIPERLPTYSQAQGWCTARSSGPGKLVSR